MSLLREGASGGVNNSIPLAKTLLLLPRRRRQLSAFDFEIAPTIAYKRGPVIQRGPVPSRGKVCAARMQGRLAAVFDQPERHRTEQQRCPCGFEGYADHRSKSEKRPSDQKHCRCSKQVSLGSPTDGAWDATSAFANCGHA